jgi:UDP-N-acetylmuramate--alanine ligase
MNNINIEELKGKHIHFIGIGGISMSGLAQILLRQGCLVTGSDIKASTLTQKLSDSGAIVYIGHKADNVIGADLVVYTAAIHNDNPELNEADRLGIPTVDRATFLGQIMKNYGKGIAVAGTHGKTTTTSIISIILQNAGLDPTVLVGGELDAIGGNVCVGQSQYFVTEACEYVESFLKFYPYIAVILNIERDHLDYFKDLDEIYNAFLSFAKLTPDDGYVVGCIDDSLVERLLNDMPGKAISYGIDKPAHWTAADIAFDKKGFPSFNIYCGGLNMGRFSLSIPGRHNIYNALASVAVADLCGIDIEMIKESLRLYKGAHRRFEVKGQLKEGVTVIDDYAHHPTEIKATIQAALHYPHNQIWCVFQPHTYTRTRLLLDEFASAFYGIDHLIITDIYAAREVDDGSINSKDLALRINQAGQNAIYMQDFSSIERYILDNCQAGDIIITMGAGDVYKIGDDLLEYSMIIDKII